MIDITPFLPSREGIEPETTSQEIEGITEYLQRLDTFLDFEGYHRCEKNDGFGWYLHGLHPQYDSMLKEFRNHVLFFPDKRIFVAVLTHREEGRPRDLVERTVKYF